ncbi:MAG: hypothetical protein JWQ01_3245 [Massilia sp.]|nr:hypothetical protein [Massilia sp.]
MVSDVVEEAMVGYPDIVFRVTRAGTAMIEGDGDRLAQVVSNLLGNARSHGQRGGSVDVFLSVDATHAIFSVSNAAEALDESTVRTLYAPFKAASLENSHNRGGMGLGLFIVERIVAEHGGTIAYAHVEGRVTFTVAIPLSPQVTCAA